MKNDLRGLQKFLFFKVRLITYTIYFCLMMLPLQIHSDILVPTYYEMGKFIASKYLHTLGPTGVYHVLTKIENILKEHDKHIPAGGKKIFDLYVKNRAMFTDFACHMAWKAGTDAPFIAMNAHSIPGLIAYSLSQTFFQNIVFPNYLKSDKFWKKVFKENKIKTFDLKLGDNRTVACYFKKGKLVVEESIWSIDRGFIKKIEYSDDGVSAVILLNKKVMHLSDDMNTKLVVKLKSENFLAKDINNLEVYHGKLSNEATSLVSETYINSYGSHNIWSRLKSITPFFFESGSIGYETSVAEVFNKLTKIIVSSNISWPIYEVGKQLLGNGVLNLSLIPLHSWGLFNAFLMGGYWGAAMGSRSIDAVVYLMLRTDRKFSNLVSRVPIPEGIPGITRNINRKFISKTKDKCTNLFGSFVNQILNKNYGNIRAVRKRMLGKRVTLNEVGSVLEDVFGRKYLYGRLIAGMTFGGIMSNVMPVLYSKGQDKYLEGLKNREIPFEEIEGAPKGSPQEKLFYMGDGIVESEVNEDGDDNMVDYEKYKRVVNSVVPSFQLGVGVGNNLIVNKDNDLAYKQSFNSIVDQYKKSKRELESHLNSYDNDEDMQKKKMWISYIMYMPIRNMQNYFLEKMDKAGSLVDAKNIFNEFLRSNKLFEYKDKIINMLAINDKTSEGEYFLKIIKFIIFSDVLILNKQIQYWERVLESNEKKIIF